MSSTQVCKVRASRNLLPKDRLARLRSKLRETPWTSFHTVLSEIPITRSPIRRRLSEVGIEALGRNVIIGKELACERAELHRPQCRQLRLPKPKLRGISFPRIDFRVSDRSSGKRHWFRSIPSGVQIPNTRSPRRNPRSESSIGRLHHPQSSHSQASDAGSALVFLEYYSISCHWSK